MWAPDEPASVVALRQLAAEARERRRMLRRRSARPLRPPVEPRAHAGEDDGDEQLGHADATLLAGEPRR
jgi:hypothetical protein